MCIVFIFVVWHSCRLVASKRFFLHRCRCRFHRRRRRRWYDENVLDSCARVRAHSRPFMFTNTDLVLVKAQFSNCVDIPMNIEVFFLESYFWSRFLLFLFFFSCLPSICTIDVRPLFVPPFHFGLIKYVRKLKKIRLRTRYTDRLRRS